MLNLEHRSTTMILMTLTILAIAAASMLSFADGVA
jgi:hypothetical protein